MGVATLSGHRMTTGFSPFELPTRGLVQKGRDHGSMGGVIITLTRGMGEPTYRPTDSLSSRLGGASGRLVRW